MKKIITLVLVLISMIAYIGWVFYISEPQYINNCNKSPEQYDYVSLPDYTYHFMSNQEVYNGLVLQVDDKYALVKVDKTYNDAYYELDLKKSKFRVIGTGTIYHKVNGYIGFNIMMITQVLIGILLVILAVYVIGTIKEILNSY